MTRNLVLGVAIALGVGIFWTASRAPQQASPPAVAAAPLPDRGPTPPPPEEVPVSTPRASAAPASPALDAEESARLAMLRTDAELEERARQQRLAPEADARWADAVDREGYHADDLDPAIRGVFRHVSLEPRYAEGGRIEGLVIRDVAPDHPLARAGFAPGDLIDRIQGVPLRDPAAIPSLLARLGPRVSFCADRDGAEICRELVLD